MSHKQVLIIREVGDFFQKQIELSDTERISTWCCINQGETKLHAKFNKNVFEQNDKAKAEVSIDNTKCNLNMHNITFALEQHLKLEADHQTHPEKIILVSKHMNGAQARSILEKQTIELDLGERKLYTAQDVKKKKGVTKPVSVEDRFMQENVAPRCTGEYVKNNIFLTIRCSYDGCTCCAELPMAQREVSIVPIINPQVWATIDQSW